MNMHARIFVGESYVRSLRDQYNTLASKVESVGTGNCVSMMGFENARYGARNILFVGLDGARKGGPDVVTALAKLLRANPDAHPTIVGCRPKANLPNCTIVGKVSHEETASRAIHWCYK